MNIECVKERINTVQHIDEVADFIRYNYADAVSTLLNDTLEQHIPSTSISLKDWYVAFTNYWKNAEKRDARVATELMEYTQREVGIEKSSQHERFLMDILLHLSTLNEDEGRITSIMLDEDFISNSKIEHLIARMMYKALRNEFRKVFVEDYQYDLLKYVTRVYFKQELPFILERMNELHNTDNEEHLYKIIPQEVNSLRNITVQDELLVYLYDLQVVNGEFKAVCTRSCNDVFISMGLDGELGVLEEVYEKLLYFEEVFSKLAFVENLTDKKLSNELTIKDSEFVQKLSVLWEELIVEYQEKTKLLVQCFVYNYKTLKNEEEIGKMNKVEIIEVTCDLIRFECVACGKEQVIVATNPEVEQMKKDIENGVNPFEEGWEDGIGNTIYCDCE